MGSLTIHGHRCRIDENSEAEFRAYLDLNHRGRYLLTHHGDYVILTIHNGDGYDEERRRFNEIFKPRSCSISGASSIDLNRRYPKV